MSVARNGIGSLEVDASVFDTKPSKVIPRSDPLGDLFREKKLAAARQEVKDLAAQAPLKFTPSPRPTNEVLGRLRYTTVTGASRNPTRGAPADVMVVLKRISHANGITVHDLLKGPQFKEIVAARRQMTATLRAMNFGWSQISRWTGFHHTTLLSHMWKAPKLFAQAKDEANVIPCPDESGIWAI